MRHILKKPWCHEKHLASILDELFKAWFHHQCDPSCWICSTIHVLEEISWDTAREAATTCNNHVIRCIRLTCKRQDLIANRSTSNTSALLQVKILYASCHSSAKTWNRNAAVNYDAFLTCWTFLTCCLFLHVSAICRSFIQKKVFLASFSQFRTKIDKSLKCGDLQPSTLLFNLFHFGLQWETMQKK